jgi:L-alanine-DL-glutamate epimerase-like enolase superfamily enzyme
MKVPQRPGLGFTLSEQARRWTRHEETIKPHGKA